MHGFPAADVALDHPEVLGNFILDKATPMDEIARGDHPAVESEAATILRAAGEPSRAAVGLAPVEHAGPTITLRRATVALHLYPMLGYEPMGSRAHLELIVQLSPHPSVVEAVLSVVDDADAARVHVPSDHPLVIAAVTAIYADTTAREAERNTPPEYDW